MRTKNEALEQLTSGDAELPYPEGFMDHSIGGDMAYTKYQLINYGNRRAAQAVTAFLERSGKYLTNDATREAAIKAAVLAERESVFLILNALRYIAGISNGQVQRVAEDALTRLSKLKGEQA